jgi:hypothetical protein
MTTPSMRISNEPGEKETKMPFILATYVYTSSQGQRTHSARTNFFEPFVSYTYLVYDAKLLLAWLMKT